MKSRARTLLAGAFVTSLAILASGVQAGPGPRPPNANQYGKGYAELTAEWLEWTVAVSASTNPILDLDGANAATGQSAASRYRTTTFSDLSNRCAERHGAGRKARTGVR